MVKYEIKKSLRNSGINVIGNVPWGTHFCLFYQTKQDLIDILVPYFKAGLENNEFCIWVTSQPLEVEEAKEALRKSVPDFEIYLEKGQIEIFPYTYGYIKEGFLDSEIIISGWGEKLNRALEKGYEGLRTAGNISWLKKGEWDYFVDYEKKEDSSTSKRKIIYLCPYFLDKHNVADIIDRAFNHEFVLIKKEGKWERIKNYGRKDITDHKLTEDILSQGEQRIRPRLKNILSPGREISNLKIAEIIDVQAIQSLMDDFYKFAHITMALLDLKGNVLVGIGWQDICTEFHRVHPDACKHCVESDTELSLGVAPGECKLYRCKNNMWDIATPIIVAGQHVGNIFSGQFFFEDEILNYELFRSQAKKYGFNEEEYIAALEKVPRLSREAVHTGMSFFTKLANMISQLSYSNIKLAQSLEERDSLVDALQESEEKYRNLIETASEGIWILDAEARTAYVNEKMAEMLGYSQEEMIGKSAWDFADEEGKAILKLNLKKRRQGINEIYEFNLICEDGKTLWVLISAKSLFNKEGKFTGSLGMFTDITERKKAEEALKKAYASLEEKVKERTVELEEACKSLLENERRLNEAQKIAHLGNWDWDIVNDKVYWSDELYRICGAAVKKFISFNDALTYVHPDDREYVATAIKEAFNEKPYDIDYRIISDNGEERIVHTQAEVIFDEKKIPIRMIGIVQDITERKKTEEKIQILANAVESSNDAIVTESLDGIITSWNKAAEQIYGYSAEEILGKDVSILEPDNIKGEIKSFSEKIKQGKKVQHYETLRLKKDGNLINISVTLSPILNASGELVAFSAIVRDVTERKKSEKALLESEARLRRFYESGMFGVVYYSMNDSITDANDKFLEMVGYTHEDLQAGKVNWNKMTPSEYRLLDEKCIAELKATGIYAPYEKEYIRKDGSRVSIILGAATFDHERQEGIAFVLDNTERKKTEKALAEMDRIRIKEIHHRIKNNLQVISSLLDLQAEKFDDKNVREAFKEGQSRVVSMSLIHEELYKGKGDDRLDFSAYLKKLAENLFQTYSLSSKKVRLLIDLEENAFFDMDTAVPLGIIVNELVSNSLKHAFNESEEGEVRIRLCREEKKKETNKSLFSLTISDNGKGIPEDIELESLESLGLQLVSALVDQLDGEIEITRMRGTEFRITFNVAEKL